MSLPTINTKPEYSGDNHPCNQKQVVRQVQPPVPHSKAALAVFKTFRECQYGCFTSEPKAENRRRLTRLNPYPIPRGNPGFPPSYWTEKAGHSTSSEWVDPTQPQFPDDFDRRQYWQKGTRF